MPRRSRPRGVDVSLTSVLVVYALLVAVFVTPLALLGSDLPRIKELFAAPVYDFPKADLSRTSLPADDHDRTIPSGALLLLQGTGVACGCYASHRASRKRRPDWDRYAKAATALGTIAFLFTLVVSLATLTEAAGRWYHR